MLKINQIDQIKELLQQGFGLGEIAMKLRLDCRTIRTYMHKEDFSQPRRVPVAFPPVPVNSVPLSIQTMHTERSYTQ